jgi:hypothetical protein
MTGDQDELSGGFCWAGGVFWHRLWVFLVPIKHGFVVWWQRHFGFDFRLFYLTLYMFLVIPSYCTL